MKDEKFKIIQFIREFILHIDNQLDNFPKKDIELKNRLRNTSYDLLEIAYSANSTTSQEQKIRELEKLFAKVKVIDFLLNLCYEKRIINAKRYAKFGNKIEDIIKYVTGWYKSIQN